jgi:hypothetical protein
MAIFENTRMKNKQKFILKNYFSPLDEKSSIKNIPKNIADTEYPIIIIKY